MCRSNLLALDAAAREARPHPRAVRDLYRSFHTLKGLAAMVGVQPIVEIAHRLENVLRAADRAGAALAHTAVDILVQGLDAVEGRVQAVGAGEEVARAAPELLESLDALEPTSDDEDRAPEVRLSLDASLRAKLTQAERAHIIEGIRSGQRAVRLEVIPSPDRAARGLGINAVRERLEVVGEIVRVLPVARQQSEEIPGGLAFVILLVTGADDARVAEAAGVDAREVEPLVAGASPADEPPAEPAPAPSAIGGAAVRVDLDRVDHAIKTLSDLVVTRFKLDRAIASLADTGPGARELRAVADEQARQLRDMRRAILQLRMVPVGEVLERLRLVVRGLRSTTGKPVDLRVEETGAEIDKSVAERLFPALVHLVRNAVDHGLERPDRRRELGKPEEGRLWIRVSEPAGERLQLTIEDDGAGVDASLVAARLKRPPPQTDGELLDMLVHPGLSTRETADATSGRGMGMDIVHRSVVRQLGGQLLLENRPGHGSTFTLHVPFTVSIVDSLSFTCARQSFAVPLLSVAEIVDLDELPVMPMPAAPGSRRPPRAIVHRGEVVPYADLADVFDLPRNGDRARRALVVRRDHATHALGIDRTLGQQEIVLRPLEDRLVRRPGIVGSTDLGDGRPTLVLDPVAFGGAEAPVEDVFS